MKKRPPEGILAPAGPVPADLTGLLRRIGPAFLVIGVWLFCHSYRGIDHDSRLYVAQALNRLDPAVFGQDIFFRFGSQDDFTIFSYLFAPLVHRLGPDSAAMIVVAVGQALWLSGLAALAVRLASERAIAVVGLLFAAGLPAIYAGWQVFSFGEGFATPRLLAEGFSLWALWALVGNRYVQAVVCAAAAAILHPLVSLTVFSVGFLFLVLGNWRWVLFGIAGAIAIGAAAYLDVSPFGRLLQTMDPEWRAIVEQRNIYLFPTLWRPLDWGTLVFAAMLNLAGVVILSGWRRRLVLSVLSAGVLGLLVSLIAGDVFGNLFLLQVQLFRMIWLLHLFGYLSAAILFGRLWRLKDDGLSLIVAIASSWLVAQFVEAATGVGLGILAVGFAGMRLRGRYPAVPPRLQVVIFTLGWLLFVGMATARTVIVFRRMEVMPADLGFWQAWIGATAIDFIAVTATVAALQRVSPRVAGLVIPALGLVLAIGGVAEWSGRNRVPSGITAEGRAMPFEGKLAADAQVYWENDVRGAWLLLRRPSYVSFAQGAGNVFNRDMALTLRDRIRVIEPLVNVPMLDWFRQKDRIPPPLPTLTRDMLVAACRQAHGLDALVLSRAVPGAYAATWTPPVPIYDEKVLGREKSPPPIRAFYLYRCADLR